MADIAESIKVLPLQHKEQMDEQCKHHQEQMNEQARQSREKARRYKEEMDEQAKNHRGEMDKRKDEMKPLIIEAVYNGAKGNSTLVSCFQPCDSSFEL